MSATPSGQLKGNMNAMQIILSKSVNYYKSFTEIMSQTPVKISTI